MTEKKPCSESPQGEILTEGEVQAPKMYQVVLLNDDYTPMDFVVWILQTVFHKVHDESVRLMLDVHQKGRGLCGIYPYDIAQTKVYRVKGLAKKEEHPLECVMEAVEE